MITLLFALREVASELAQAVFHSVALITLLWADANLLRFFVKTLAMSESLRKKRCEPNLRCCESSLSCCEPNLRAAVNRTRELL